MKMTYVRIDLVAMWSDGKLKEDSFADLHDEAHFRNFFKGAIDEDFLVENGINFGACCAASSRLKEVLIGIRGDWWPQY